mmetsp:Transcript_120371/g.347920  ORF Transcript_120371/g.347920 Transcript_120371/m.347920 type:complete len:134 (-) Transcript_120371:34-435(-)
MDLVRIKQVQLGQIRKISKRLWERCQAIASCQQKAFELLQISNGVVQRSKIPRLVKVKHLQRIPELLHGRHHAPAEHIRRISCAEKDNLSRFSVTNQCCTLEMILIICRSRSPGFRNHLIYDNPVFRWPNPAD